MTEPAPPHVSGRALFVPIAAWLIAQVTVIAVLRPTTDTTHAFFDWRFGVMVILSYLAFGAATLWVARQTGQPAAVLALRRAPIGRSAVLVVVSLGLAALITQLLEPVFHGVASQGIKPGAFPGGASATTAVVLTAVGTALLGPTVEELFFRGLVYGWLAQFGSVIAVSGSSAAFAAAHLEPRAFPVLFVYGALLGWLRLETGSLWPGVVMHAANNTLALVFTLAT
jgi:uncharacterized protein